jgi:hypothetical protein
MCGCAHYRETDILFYILSYGKLIQIWLKCAHPHMARKGDSRATPLVYALNRLNPSSRQGRSGFQLEVSRFLFNHLESFLLPTVVRNVALNACGKRSNRPWGAGIVARREEP